MRLIFVNLVTSACCVACILKKILPFILFLLCGAAHAETGLRITSHSINMIAGQPELCLQLSKPIVMRDRNALAAALRLRQDGKEVVVGSRQLSLAPDQLCVQKLKAESNYQLQLRSVAGERLPKTYMLEFRTPSITPELSLSVENVRLQELPAIPASKISQSIKLETINVKAVRLVLYRIKSAQDYAQAYQQHLQSGRTPSESLTFAKEFGEQVWQSDLQLPQTATELRTISQPELPNALRPGLYFLAATPAQNQDQAFTDPTYLSGRWFRVGNLTLAALQLPEALHVATRLADNGQAIASVPIQLRNQAGDIVAEQRTDATGLAEIKWQSEWRKQAAYITAEDPQLGMAIIGLDKAMQLQPTPAPHQLIPDQDHYQAGEQAVFTLIANDYHGKPLMTEAGWLRLYRPDWSMAAETAVPTGKTGPVLMRIDLPARGQTGIWRAEWQDLEGRVQARTAFHIMAGQAWGQVRVDVADKAIEANGTLHVTIRSRNAEGAAWAFQQGMVEWRPTQSAETKDFAPLASFLTDQRGEIRLPLNLPLSEMALLPKAAELRVSMLQAREPVIVTLPINQARSAVAVRTLPEIRHGYATFNLVPKDEFADVIGTDSIYFNVYESGRKFRWYQQEENWAYEALPERRRIGGGSLNLSSDGATQLEWPIGLGKYNLELLTAAGDRLADHEFTGGLPENTMFRNTERLQFKPVESRWSVGKAAQLAFEMPQAGRVWFTIMDQKTQEVRFLTLPAGKQRLTIKPTDDWGVSVRAALIVELADGQKLYQDFYQPVVGKTQSQYEIKSNFGKKILSGRNASWALELAGFDAKTASVSLLVTEHGQSGSDDFAPILIEGVRPSQGRFDIRPYIPEYEGEIALQMVAWDAKGWARKEMILPAHPTLRADMALPAAVQEGDDIATGINLARTDLPKGRYRYVIDVSEGLKAQGRLSGELNFTAEQSVTLPLALHVDKSGAQNVTVRISGAKDFRYQKSWPIQVISQPRVKARDGWTLAAGQEHTLSTLEPRQTETQHYLVGAIPLQGTGVVLANFVQHVPFTTPEIARWLETAISWREQILGTSLLTPENLDSLLNERRKTLMARQNPDGGFGLQSGDGQSDLESTALAYNLMAADAFSRKAALHWVQSRLDNSWQTESDIAARSLAFLVLARNRDVDVAALNYFAHAALPQMEQALAAAQIALAFASIEDKDAALIWTDKAKQLLQSTKPDQNGYLAAWATLARNPLIKIEELLTDYSASLPNIRPTPAMLDVTTAFAERLGVYQLSIDGVAKEWTGIQRLTVSNNLQKLAIKNTDKRLLAIEPIPNKTSPTNSAKANMKLSFYTLDGMIWPDGTPLQYNQTYLALVELRQRGLTQIFLPNLGALKFMPMNKIVQQDLTAALPWLGNLTDGFVTATQDGAYFAPTNPTNQPVRVAMLFQVAAAGGYAFPPAYVQTQAGSEAVIATQAGRINSY